MATESAGILLWRGEPDSPEVLLAHPGGPYWKNRDQAAWSIPKGEFDADRESPLDAARREFREETGHPIDGEAIDLGRIRQAGGKWVHAFGIRGDLDPDTIEPNTFDLEWPPKSGKTEPFPEIDRAEWFALDEARNRINPAQRELLTRLGQHLRGD